MDAVINEVKDIISHALFNGTIRVSTINLAGISVCVVIHSLREGEKPVNNIIENAPGFSRFMMHLDPKMGSGGKYEMECIGIPWDLKQLVKYRKISGKTPQDVAEKFAKWIEKAAPAYDKLRHWE